MPVDRWSVQGRSGSDRELLDTAALVGHLVPAGSVYAFLAEHRGEVFPDGMFADLFPSGKGRPSVPGAVIASVLVLPTLHDSSDAEAVDALRCDLRWKMACGLPIDHAGFHPTTLTVWRNRLRGSDRPERILRGGPGGDRRDRCAQGQTPPGRPWIRWFWTMRWPPRTR